MNYKLIAGIAFLAAVAFLSGTAAAGGDVGTDCATMNCEEFCPGPCLSMAEWSFDAETVGPECALGCSCPTPACLGIDEVQPVRAN